MSSSSDSVPVPNALDMFEQPPQSQRIAMREVSKVYYNAGNADQTFSDMAAKYKDMKSKESKVTEIETDTETETVGNETNSNSNSNSNVDLNSIESNINKNKL